MMEAELTVLSETIRQAGARALDLARRGFEVQTKKDRSPVTSADLEVNRILHEMQRKHFPDDGWLSEESPDDPDRLGKTRLWIVDPIDGTRSFIAGREDWAVCAALVERGRPVAAAVELPATGESFAAIRGGGATKNGQKISVSKNADILSAAIAWPAKLNQAVTSLGNLVAVPRIHSIAVRLSRVAAGEIDGALASANANDWDLAAPDLLVHEAGGKLTDAMGRMPVYNVAGKIHGALIAAGSELHPKLVSALAGSLR